MIKRCLFVTVGAAALIIAGCAKQKVETSPVTTATKTVTLTLDAASQQTKVSHTDSGTVDLVWNEGDKVLVVDAASSTKVQFTLVEGAGSSTGIFSGDVPASATTLDVYYPSDIDTNPISYALQTQTGDASLAHIASRDLMSALNVQITDANTAKFPMSHQGIIFTIPILNSTGVSQDIVGLTIANRKDYYQLYFGSNVRLENNAIERDLVSSVDLAFAHTLATGATATAYVPVYMFDYTMLADKSLDIYVHTKTGRYQVTKTGISMAPGFRYTISDVVMTAANFADDLYLVGNAFESGSSYVVADKITMTNNLDGTYTWSGPLFASGSAFRFSNVIDEWGSQTFEIYDGGDAMAINAHPDDNDVPQFMVEDEGLYNLTVNFNTMKVVVAKTADQRFIYPVGNATVYGWTLANGNYLPTYAKSGDDEIVSGTLILTVDPNAAANGSYIKFTRRANFLETVDHIIPTGSNKEVASGSVQPFQMVKDPGVVGDDFLWYVTTSGQYDVEINYTQQTIKFDYVAPDGITLPSFGNGSF